MPKQEQPQPDLTVISVRVTRETADRLNAIAAAEYRSTAAELRRLIEERIAEAAEESERNAA